MSNPVSLPTVQSTRNQTIELIRVIAAYGVIAIHVVSSTIAAEGIGRFFVVFCVPFFYVSALTYFVIGLKPPYSLRDTLIKIWWRMAVPYLAWTVIYFLLQVAKKWMTGQPISFEYWKIIFYGNSAVQLYFLPQLIVMQLLITSIFLLTTLSIKKVFQALGILTCAISFLLIGYAANCFGMTTPNSILTYTLGAFLLGAILKSKLIHSSHLVSGICIFAICIAREFVKLPFTYSPVLRFLPLAGIALMLISIYARMYKLPKIFLTLAEVSFGIYLCHVLFLEMFEMAVSKIFTSGLRYNFLTKAGVALFLFILSAVFSLFINRFTFLRQLLLGKSK